MKYTVDSYKSLLYTHSHHFTPVESVSAPPDELLRGAKVVHDASARLRIRRLGLTNLYPVGDHDVKYC